MSSDCLAFIPARGGSKRIPNKNMLVFNGKPLIYYTIKAAQNARCFRDIVISTDSEVISNYALSLGCEVVRRPHELATDTASTAQAAQHVLQYLKDSGRDYECLATLQPTNPLRTKHLISDCLNTYVNNTNIDSLITVSLNDKKIGIISNGYYKSKNYKPGQRSQDLKNEYFENGLLYISKADMVIEKADLFGTKVIPFIVDHWSGYIDIDEMYEFEIAEYLYKKHNKELDII